VLRRAGSSVKKRTDLFFSSRLLLCFNLKDNGFASDPCHANRLDVYYQPPPAHDCKTVLTRVSAHDRIDNGHKS
jgi:hypothetical protein